MREFLLEETHLEHYERKIIIQAACIEDGKHTPRLTYVSATRLGAEHGRGLSTNLSQSLMHAA